MTKETIFGIIRHILTFGGGFLASNGTIGGADVETGVGALISLIGIVWSAIQKRKAAPANP